MKHKITFLPLLLLFSLHVFAGGQKRKVLLIGIDGTRTDALLRANTPNIDSLIAKGFYTLNSWHTDITISGPSWSSILTGVYHSKHGVTDNSYNNSNYWDFPYFTTRAKEVKPALRCAERVEWNMLQDGVYNANWDIDSLGEDTNSGSSGTDGANMVADPDLDCFFLYFDAVDHAGHTIGFNPDSAAYISAIEGVDSAIGRVLTAMRARPTYSDEDWLILMVTDHGGIGQGHGGNSIYERSIWWLAYSDRGVHLDQSTVAPQCAVYDNNGMVIEHDSTYNHTCDPGTRNVMVMAPHVLAIDSAAQKLAPVQADIAVTALHHLIYGNGVLPDTVAAWRFDGKSWLCEMGLCDDISGVKEAKESLFSMFANSSSNSISLWIAENAINSIVRIYNLQGQLLREERIRTNSIRQNLTVENMPHGNYVLQLEQNGKSSARVFNW